jgi:two-component system response regulator FlrC
MTQPVMVVDDEPMVRQCLASAVKEWGREVITAGDGEEAFLKFREYHPSVVLTDLRMPKMDGLALIRSIKRTNPQTPMVLMTGFWSEDLVTQALREGASRVLPKPVPFADLDALLEDLTQASRGVPSAPDAPILTSDARMETTLALARRVAKTEATVLVSGETGTGKELMARFIHRSSPRANGPFVAVNCAALPESLIESELFGHERGAFTGAVGRRTGRFEAASRGTLVLDEVTEIPLGLQAKLLRALQEREIDRVGGSAPVKVDVRVIAMTNRDTRVEVAEGRFRPDLFYRLNVLTLNLPALRERPADIPVLSRYFLRKYGAMHRSPAEGFTPEAIDVLLAHTWPGNVRELENVVQRAVLLNTDRRVGPEAILIDALPQAVNATATPAAASGRTVADVEKDLILSTLERLNGNRTQAARALGVSVRTVRNRLRDYRLAY